MLTAFSAFAQRDAQFSMYMFNPLFYNPGYAGVEGMTKITAMHRSQWLGYDPSIDPVGGAPTTQVLSLSTPILRFRSGVGVHLVNDNLGPLNNIEAQVAYAYHLAIDDAKLSFGVRAGIYSQTIQWDKYRWANPSDPLNAEGQESQIRPDLAAGVYLRAQKYFAGVSFTHLIKSEFDFGQADLRNALEKHMTVLVGYDYEFNYDLIITPSILFKSNFTSFSVEGSVIGTYKDRLWGGVSLRQEDAAGLMVGYSLLKDNSLKLGYAFDYVVFNADAKARTGHEFLLSYSLPVASGSGKKVIRTPRFRH